MLSKPLIFIRPQSHATKVFQAPRHHGNVLTSGNSIRQYKYRLKKWEINKNTTSETKERAIAAIRKRARDGIDVGGVRFRGEELDKKRLRRHVMAQAQVPQELHLNRIM